MSVELREFIKTNIVGRFAGRAGCASRQGRWRQRCANRSHKKLAETTDQAKGGGGFKVAVMGVGASAGGEASDEGVCAAPMGNLGAVPLIAADEARLESARTPT